LAQRAGSDDGGKCGADACSKLADAIHADYDPAGKTCTTVVRVDYLRLTLLGYSFSCGGYGQVDEATARATAQAVLGVSSYWSLISGPNPEDDYVFYNPPADIGGVGVVSARSGLPVFGGSIVWMGANRITYPTSWKPASELGAGCSAVGDVRSLRFLDLTMGAANATQSDADKAVKQVWSTALPAGFAKGQYVFDGMVLLFPSTVPPDDGDFNPATAEWIVVINTGWLE
jgi:hypothetical protein